MTTSIALGISIAFLVLGVAAWVAREAERRYAPPKRRVPTRVYRLLENARDCLFKGSPDIRFTVFVPDFEGKVLVPFARIGWGQPSAESEVVFAAGEGLAGLAIERPDGILIARFGPFEDIEEAREAHRTTFNLTQAQAAALSVMQLKSKVLLASCLQKGMLLKGVLCIDSLDPALVPMDAGEAFWNALNCLVADLAGALPDPGSAIVEKEKVREDPGLLVSQITIGIPLRPTQDRLTWPAVIPPPVQENPLVARV